MIIMFDILNGENKKRNKANLFRDMVFGEQNNKRNTGNIMNGKKKSQSNTVIGDKVTKPQRRVMRKARKQRKPMLMFTDRDKDGVINGLDCRPNNRKKHSFTETFQKFKQQPKSGEKGQCEQAASEIACEARKEGTPEKDIEFYNVKAPNYKKGDYSSHVVTKIGDKYYDPTKSQFGYDDGEISEELDERYTDVRKAPKSFYLNKKDDSVEYSEENTYKDDPLVYIKEKAGVDDE